MDKLTIDVERQKDKSYKVSFQNICIGYLYKEKVKTVGSSKYVGHIPAHERWGFDVEETMDTFCYYHYFYSFKEAVEGIEQLIVSKEINTPKEVTR